MAHPTLVHPSPRPPHRIGSPTSRNPALPPISAFSFADILRAADGPDLQAAIEGIAEICAKNRMSLAEEYASHKPPVGEITGAEASPSPSPSVAVTRPPGVGKPPVRRALTSVPEGSSSGSEGSRSGRQRRGSLLNFIAGVKKVESKTGSVRVIRIGRMGRTVSAGCTTALSGTVNELPSLRLPGDVPMRPRTRATSAACISLQRLLEARSRAAP